MTTVNQIIYGTKVKMQAKEYTNNTDRFGKKQKQTGFIRNIKNKHNLKNSKCK